MAYAFEVVYAINCILVAIHVLLATNNNFVSNFILFLAVYPLLAKPLSSLCLPAQMGYVAAAPSLSDRSRLQSYYRTYPSDAIFVPGIIAVIEFYGWRELCLITEEANTFMMVNTCTSPRLNMSLLASHWLFCVL